VSVIIVEAVGAARARAVAEGESSGVDVVVAQDAEDLVVREEGLEGGYMRASRSGWCVVWIRIS
jgi:hypothetical protein